MTHHEWNAVALFLSFVVAALAAVVIAWIADQ